MRARLQRVFDLAKAPDSRLDFHVNEELGADACGLKMIAGLTIANGYQGKVTCGHCCILSIQSLAEAQNTLQPSKDAGIYQISVPITNLHLQGARGATPVEREITLLKKAFSHGIRAVAATDNVADAFYPCASHNLMASTPWRCRWAT